MHADGCFRSDGEWICAAGRTHGRDEALAEASAAACTVADAWAMVLRSRDLMRREYGTEPRPLETPALASALDRLEQVTRLNPLRKVRPE